MPKTSTTHVVVPCEVAWPRAIQSGEVTVAFHGLSLRTGQTTSVLSGNRQILADGVAPLAARGALVLRHVVRDQVDVGAQEHGLQSALACSPGKHTLQLTSQGTLMKSVSEGRKTGQRLCVKRARVLVQS